MLYRGSPVGGRRAARCALLAATLLAAALLVGMAGGCRRERDRRPWMICHRIYDQCRSAIGTLTQEQCEAHIAARPPQEIGALLDCVRDKFCERFTSDCKQPIHRRPGL